jgi:hypothetical protein
MNSTLAHLIVFVSLLIFFAVIIITGHDTSPLLSTLLTGAIGGSGGSAVGALLNGFFGSSGTSTTVTQVTKPNGFIHYRLLIAMCFGAVLCAVVAACSTLTSTTPSTSVAESCATASAAIKTVTVVQQAGKLSTADVATVNQALTVVNPICESTTQPSNSTVASAALVAAVAELTTLQTHYATAAGP